uniref:RanBP2-type domain-containing protein n=1 Tax=Amorphochlora amoebiformis TaxID=1561963 RepID=A0A7S0DAB9_9EUKA|mmetsp:Transcript_22520/g.35359  ORF Transcript_22520/g.35359 Transcript_22520/m.35359 type:complete len:325 (+) Transcript_22520:1-975(+)
MEIDDNVQFEQHLEEAEKDFEDNKTEDSIEVPDIHIGIRVSESDILRQMENQTVANPGVLLSQKGEEKVESKKKGKKTSLKELIAQIGGTPAPIAANTTLDSAGLRNHPDGRREEMPSDSSFHDSLFDQAKPPSSHPKSPKPRLPTPIYTPIHCSSPDPIQFSNSTPIYTPKATPVHISKAHPKRRPSPGISAGSSQNREGNDKAPDSWICPACTFENTSYVIRCSMCGTSPNPTSQGEVSGEIHLKPKEKEFDAKGENFWECSMCTLHNKLDFKVCNACETPRVQDKPLLEESESSKGPSNSTQEGNESVGSEPLGLDNIMFD